MIEYNPKDAVMCWPAGIYDAVLAKVDETKKSKQGNDMYVLTFEVFDREGNGSMFVTEYAVIPTGLFRVKKFARAIGEEFAFEAGTFDPAQYVNVALQLDLEIQKQEGFDDKNRVKAYLPKRQHASAKAKGTPIEQEKDEALPF